MGEAQDAKTEHVLCTLPFPENGVAGILERIQKGHPQIQITYRDLSHQEPFAKDSGISEELWKEATIIVTFSALPSEPSKSPNLKLVHLFSAGVNHLIKHPVYTNTLIPFTTSSGIHGPQIAEWVIMTALVASHDYHTLRDWQKDHNWGKAYARDSHFHTTRDFSSQRLGVLGYGSIGRQVARVAKAMGMDVIAYTATPRDNPESKKDKGFIVPGTGDADGSIPSAWYSGLDKSSLHHFLSQDIDFLLISVPLTEQTTHFLGAAEFEILSKKNAFISNISRGQILVQDDLIASLRAYADADKDRGVNTYPGNISVETGPKKMPGLRGAALDVTDPEPLPKESPLWEAPNCIVTPHISGIGVAYAERAFQVLEVNLGKMEKGEKLINVVDREKGY